MIDLHAHTTASDGTLSPSELVALARQVGLSAVAVTDHDTDSACEEAMTAGDTLGVRVVPGIELSVEDDFGGTEARFHLLALECASDSQLLRETVPYLQRERDARNREVLQVLAELGMPIGYDELSRVAGNQAGRPHIAQLLLEKNHVSSLQEAFDKYLASGAPAYRPKVVLRARDALPAIRQAGGVSIWAHPGDSRRKRLKNGTVSLLYSDEQFEAILRAWLAWGLDGLESHYPTDGPADVEWARDAVARFGLIGSGGSDFHGARKANALGDCGLAGPVPDSVLEQIHTLAASRKAALRAGR